jgi:hypothetical protein
LENQIMFLESNIFQSFFQIKKKITRKINTLKNLLFFYVSTYNSKIHFPLSFIFKKRKISVFIFSLKWWWLSKKCQMCVIYTHLFWNFFCGFLYKFFTLRYWIQILPKNKRKRKKFYYIYTHKYCVTNNCSKPKY